MNRSAFRLFVSMFVLLVAPSLPMANRYHSATAAPAAKEIGRDAPPAVGDAARDFELETLGGDTIKLSALAKQNPVVVVVLRGYPGYQCPVCIRQVGQILQRAKDVRATNAAVVFVYPGPADALKKRAQEFAKGKAFPEGFHFALDPDFKFTEAWHLRWNAPMETSYPSTFVVSKDMVVRFAKVSKTHGGRAGVDEILQALK